MEVKELFQLFLLSLRALGVSILTAEYVNTTPPFGFNIHVLIFFLGLLTGCGTAVDMFRTDA